MLLVPAVKKGQNSFLPLHYHILSPQSKRLALWLEVRDKRKINPVQILHGIALNRHSTIHLRIVEGVQGPWGILQIQFRINRKVCNTTSPLLNKQTNKKFEISKAGLETRQSIAVSSLPD